MGMRIAITLARSGVPVTGWNRSTAAFGPLAAAGGTETSDLGVLRAPTVLSVLPDVDQLEPLLPALSTSPRRTVVVMSTSSPQKMERLAQRFHEEFDIVDAPMSGGTEGAASGTLSLMVGGPAPLVAELRPLLAIIGGTVEHMGPLGSGMLAKLCNQVVVAGTLASLAEALALAEAGGLDREALVRVFEGGLADSAVLRAKAGRMLSHSYEGGGSVRNQVKDLRYADEAASTLGVPHPVTEATTTLFEASCETGNGDLDHSVVLERLRGASLSLCNDAMQGGRDGDSNP